MTVSRTTNARLFSDGSTGDLVRRVEPAMGDPLSNDHIWQECAKLTEQLNGADLRDAWNACQQSVSISRYIDSLTVQNAIGMNRLHAAEGSVATPRCVIQDLKRSLVSTELRIRKLRREAMALIREDDELRQRLSESVCSFRV